MMRWIGNGGRGALTRPNGHADHLITAALCLLTRAAKRDVIRGGAPCGSQDPRWSLAVGRDGDLEIKADMAKLDLDGVSELKIGNQTV